MISQRPVIWCLVAFAVVVFILYLSNSPGVATSFISESRKIFTRGDQMSRTSSCPKTFQKFFTKWILNYRKCLVEHIISKKTTFWNGLHAAIEKCLGDAIFRMFDVRFLSNWGDVKLVILPINPKSDVCTEVTLGVGKDIEAEKKLRVLIPNCTFYGADPILASGKVFQEMGTYFEIAVAAEAGVLEASVLEGGRYHAKNVSTITMVDFLKNYAKVNTIDYLFMDNEGPEYQLLPQFVKGGLLEKERLTICQLSVEMHGPFAAYGVNATTYENLAKAMIEKSAFVPLWSATADSHVRSFYLNVENNYCHRKFLEWRFCSDDS